MQLALSVCYFSSWKYFLLYTLSNALELKSTSLGLLHLYGHHKGSYFELRSQIERNGVFTSTSHLAWS